MILGLTGGIASGKSTVSNYLKKNNFIIYDADKIAKEIFEKEEIKKEIISNFGEDILIRDESGNINREKLKEIVFKNSDKLKILNSIIHPKVYDYFYKIRKNNRSPLKESKKVDEKNKDERNIIFDVPLLFESGINELCDKVLLIVTDFNVQIERIKKRDGLNEDLAKKIIFSQLSNEEKIKKADYIIKNNGTLQEFLEKINELIKEIKR